MQRRDRGEQIMRAAERLFTSRRFHEITLDDVAAAARVGKGTIYRHFQNKDDLFFQTAAWGLDELCDIIGRKVPEDAEFPKQMLSVCEQISAFFSRRRQLFRMMQSEEARMHLSREDLRKSWGEHHQRLLSAVGGVLAKGMQEGKLRKDVEPDVLAAFLLGMLRTRARDLPDVSESQRTIGRVVDLFFHGAGPNGNGNGRKARK